ncbi:hypothetical protein D9M69_540090 [compost metagenome]
MGDDDHGHTLLRQVLHHAQHFVAQLRVQRRGGLVEQHQFGFHRQGARNGHALLLAAGELRRVMPGALGQAHLGQQFTGQRLGVGLAGAAYADGAEGDVLQGGHLREQVELLEDHAGLLADQPLLHLGVVDLEAIDEQLPATDDLQLVDAAQQGGLARTGRADDDHHLAAADLQVDVMQHLGTAEVLGDALELDHRIFSLPSTRRRV